MKVRTKIKVEQIARFRIAGIKDRRIAELVGLSQSGLSRILATQEYRDLEEQLLTGQITDMDVALSGKVDEIRKQLAAGVPAAIRTLLDACTQRRDLKAALIASREILDRDPQRAFVRLADRPGESSLPDRLSETVLKETVSEADKVVDSLATSLTASQKVGNA